MYPISPRFAAALKTHHRIVNYAEVYTTSGLRIGDRIGITGGSITVDAEAAVRRRGTLEIIGRPELVPDTADDLLYPRTHEVKVFSGVRFDDGAAEVVPIGVFRVQKLTASESAGGGVTISVDIQDRSAKIAEARFIRPYQILAGGYTTTVLGRLLARFGFSQSWMTSSTTTPALIFDTGGDPWAEAQKLATSMGAELFFDANGVLVLRDEPDPFDDPVVWQYVSDETSQITTIGKSVDGDYGYNHVMVRGTDPGTGQANDAVWGEAVDSNPASPTYIGNPYGSSIYGDVPYLMQAYVGSSAAARFVALVTLRRVSGAAEIVALGMTGNPAHEAGDVVHLIREEVKVNSTNVLKSFTIPLGLNEMTAETKRRQIR